MLQSGIRTGELDREVTFIKSVITTSVTNEDKISSWTEIATYPTVWAKKTELPGNEVFIADRLTYVQRTVFTIRNRTDLTTLMRCVCAGRVYEILSITENKSSRSGFLDVMANLLDNEVFVAVGLGAFSVGFSAGFNV